MARDIRRDAVQKLRQNLRRAARTRRIHRDECEVGGERSERPQERFRVLVREASVDEAECFSRPDFPQGGSENRRAAQSGLTGGWIHLHENVPAVMRTADAFLRTEYECGRTCAILQNYAGEMQEGFDLFPDAPCSELLFFTQAEHDRKYREQMNALYRRFRFDGLFLQTPCLHAFDYSRSLNANLGLPERVRILTYCETPYNTRLPVRIPALNFNFRELGAAAVRLLKTSGENTPDYVIEPFIDFFQ